MSEHREWAVEPYAIGCGLAAGGFVFLAEYVHAVLDVPGQWMSYSMIILTGVLGLIVAGRATQKSALSASMVRATAGHYLVGGILAAFAVSRFHGSVLLVTASGLIAIGALVALASLHFLGYPIVDDLIRRPAARLLRHVVVSAIGALFAFGSLLLLVAWPVLVLTRREAISSRRWLRLGVAGLLMLTAALGMVAGVVVYPSPWAALFFTAALAGGVSGFDSVGVLARIERLVLNMSS